MCTCRFFVDCCLSEVLEARFGKLRLDSDGELKPGEISIVYKD